jgi:hypothetical protein
MNLLLFENYLYRYTTIKQQYDLKVNETELLQARLEQSSHHQQLEEINTLQQSIGRSLFNLIYILVVLTCI